MKELLLFLGLVGILLLSAFVTSAISWELFLISGTALLVLGFAIGLPCGFLYHRSLYLALGRDRKQLSAVVFRPTALHALVAAEAMRKVNRWFRAGAVGFVLVCAGCVLVAIGAWRSR